MYASNRQRAILAALISGAITLTPAVMPLSVALAEDSSDVAVVESDPTLSDISSNDDASGESTTTGTGTSEATEEAGSESTGTTETASSVEVRSFEEFKAAAENAAVTTIAVRSGYISWTDTVTIDHDVVINLNGDTFSIDSASPGGLVVTGGNVEINSGNIWSHSQQSDSFPLHVLGGSVTLKGGVNFHSFVGTSVKIEDGAKLTLNGGKISNDYSSDPCIVVAQNAELEVLSGEVEPRNGGKSIEAAQGAKITIKGGTFIEEESVYANDAIASNVADGYVVEKDTSYTTPRFIVKGDLGDTDLCEVSVSPSTYTYDGKAKRPQVTVTFDDVDVTNQVSVDYEDNIEVGTAKVIITPKYSNGTLAGSATATFTITAAPVVKADISDALVSYLPDYFYDGTEHKPTFSVILGTVIVPETEYTTTYKNNVNAGTAEVTITAKESGNYTGSITKTFKIERATAVVWADNKTKHVGEADPTFTATVTGLVGSDKLEYTFTRTAGETIGIYVITPTGETTQGNYKVTYAKGFLTITAGTSTGTTTSGTTTSGTTSTTYYVTQGNNTRYTAGSGLSLTMTFSGPYNLFNSLRVDGVEVPSYGYTVASGGSTTVTFTPAYLATLSAGTHTVLAGYSDGGSARGTFTIVSTTSGTTSTTTTTPTYGTATTTTNTTTTTTTTADKAGQTPSTGDAMLGGGIFALAGALTAGIGAVRKQRRE